MVTEGSYLLHHKLRVRVSVAHPDMSTPAELAIQPKVQLEHAQAKLIRAVGDILLHHLDHQTGALVKKEAREATESDWQSGEDA